MLISIAKTKISQTDVVGLALLAVFSLTSVGIAQPPHVDSSHTKVQALNSQWHTLFCQPSYSPATSAALQLAQQRAQGAIQRFVQRMLNEPHGVSWQTYLQLDELAEVLAKPLEQDFQIESNQEQVRHEFQIHSAKIEQVWRRLIGTAPGLEMPELLELRRQLGAVLSMRLRAHSNDQTANETANRCGEIAQALNQSQGRLTLATHRLAAPAVSWLRRYEQANSLIQELRSRCYPNLVIDMSHQALADLSSRQIFRTVPINQLLHGTQIVGTAQFNGVARLVPKRSTLGFAGDFQLDGEVITNLSGSKGRIALGMTSASSIVTRAPLVNYGNRFYSSAGQTIVATQLSRPSVATQRDGPVARLVRRAASAKVNAMREEIRTEISQEVAQLVSQQFDSEVGSALSTLQSTIDNSWLANTQRLDVAPTRIESNSDEFGASWSMMIGDQVGLTANVPSRLRGHSSFLAAHVHESLPNRVCERIFAGARVNNVAEVLAAVGWQRPTSLATKSLHIRFAEDAPIAFQFDRDEQNRCILQMRVSGAGYEFEGLKLVAMDFIIRYEVSVADSRLLLKRLGPIAIVPPRRGRSLRFIQQRNMLAKRLENEFPKESTFSIERLVTAANLSTRWPHLSIDQVSMDEGWMNIELR